MLLTLANTVDLGRSCRVFDANDIEILDSIECNTNTGRCIRRVRDSEGRFVIIHGETKLDFEDRPLPFRIEWAEFRTPLKSILETQLHQERVKKVFLEQVELILPTTKVPDGEYSGTWSGYKVQFQTPLGIFVGKTTNGLRGTADCIVKVVGHQFEVILKKG